MKKSLMARLKKQKKLVLQQIDDLESDEEEDQ
jgi:hypothetical protein